MVRNRKVKSSESLPHFLTCIRCGKTKPISEIVASFYYGHGIAICRKCLKKKEKESLSR